MGDASDFADRAPRFGHHCRANHIASRVPRSRDATVRDADRSKSSSVHSAPWRACSRWRTRRAASARRPRCTRSAPRSRKPGQRVLLVDLDPQACLTYSVGLDPESLPRSLHDVLVGRSKAAEALRRRGRALRAARGDRPRGLGGAPRRSRRPGARGRARARAGEGRLRRRARSTARRRSASSRSTGSPPPTSCSSRCSARRSATAASASCSRPSPTCARTPSPT